MRHRRKPRARNPCCVPTLLKHRTRLSLSIYYVQPYGPASPASRRRDSHGFHVSRLTKFCFSPREKTLEADCCAWEATWAGSDELNLLLHFFAHRARHGLPNLQYTDRPDRMW